MSSRKLGGSAAITKLGREAPACLPGCTFWPPSFQPFTAAAVQDSRHIEITGATQSMTLQVLTKQQA
jgi:hypothetical protein